MDRFVLDDSGAIAGIDDGLRVVSDSAGNGHAGSFGDLGHSGRRQTPLPRSQVANDITLNGTSWFVPEVADQQAVHDFESVEQHPSLAVRDIRVEHEMR